VRRSLSVLVTALLTVSAAICAEEKPVGYLCCNMRTDGSWISDINYDENGKRMIAVATPVKVTGYGRYRVKIEIDGKKQEIGNDYSRDLSMDEFAKRYVVAENPASKISTFPKKIQDAIASARLTKGMTREQVLMSVGYPISSENHSLDAKVWHFWLSSFQEFRTKFDDNNLLSEVEADADTRSKVWLE
jgi:hypothetical protein